MSTCGSSTRRRAARRSRSRSDASRTRGPDAPPASQAAPRAEPPDMTPSREIDRLLEIMAALRTPGTGCPWDLEQTFDTIVPFTLEEAYEVADAVERGDFADLRDELGDLLLQVVFHARMAEEEGRFDFGGVVEAITSKLIRRHPHVFGETRDLSPSEVKALWGNIKVEEKRRRAAERAAAGARPKPARRPFRHPFGAARPDPGAQAAGEGEPGRLRLGAGARGPRQASRGDRRDRGGDFCRRRQGGGGRGRRPSVRGGQSRAPSRRRSGGRAARTNAKFERRFAHIEARLGAEGRASRDREPRRDGGALGRGEAGRASERLRLAHVALLRGINVGGAHKLPMAALKAIFEAAGAARVETLIQSGNVVFEAPEDAAAAIGAEVGAAISRDFGFRAPLVVRTASQWRALIAGNPFLARGEDPKLLHALCLSAAPSAGRLAKLDPARSPPDSFAARGETIYLHLPNGVARTKLTNAWFEFDARGRFHNAELADSSQARGRAGAAATLARSRGRWNAASYVSRRSGPSAPAGKPCPAPGLQAFLASFSK